MNWGTGLCKHGRTPHQEIQLRTTTHPSVRPCPLHHKPHQAQAHCRFRLCGSNRSFTYELGNMIMSAWPDTPSGNSVEDHHTPGCPAMPLIRSGTWSESMLRWKSMTVIKALAHDVIWG